MLKPTIYGAAYSVYVRAVRLALEEKQVAYDLSEVDVFASSGPPPEHLLRHPFGRIPAFEHAGFCLYESSAIERYVDEAFAGIALQPSHPRDRARMNQVVSVLDAYAYRTLVWDIYVERVSNPTKGKPVDETRIAAALPRAATCLQVLEGFLGENNWLAGPTLTLADLHAAPMFAYFVKAPEAVSLLAPLGGLKRWWAQVSLRRSMLATEYPSAASR